jgi:hypothetical protein
LVDHTKISTNENFPLYGSTCSMHIQMYIHVHVVTYFIMRAWSAVIAIVTVNTVMHAGSH